MRAKNVVRVEWVIAGINQYCNLLRMLQMTDNKMPPIEANQTSFAPTLCFFGGW
jgi:hypothetical protein